ncbi:MAG: TonB-dependent receptor [Prevotella sp.]|nr:TonB-dependent receptor [Prevotella sp.]
MDNEPVIGASVQVIGTNVGTVTDANGRFELTLPEGKKILRITYVGMEPLEVSARANMRIVLADDENALSEIVVTGYGVTRKAAFTGAASTVSSKTIANKTDANPIKALEGSVSGLQLTMESGQPGAPATVFIRGRNSLNSGTQPLYVIDGVAFSSDVVGIRADEGQEISPLANLNANDIESITVLKDATATSIYGARAANGVIVITTKKGKSGKAKVNFNAKVGWQFMPAYKHFKSYPVTADKYNELWAEACANEKTDLGEDGAVQYYMDALGLNYDAEGYKDFMVWGAELYTEEGKTTNWLDAITRNGLTQNYSVDVQGGGAVAGTPSYYLSLDYLRDEAVVIGKDLTRYSFRFNFEHAPSKIVKFGFNTNLVYSETNMGSGGGYFTDPITQAYMQSPLSPVKKEDGTWNFYTVNGYNPVAIRSDLGDQSLAKQYRVLFSPWAQINFTPELYFLTRGSIDAHIVDEFGFWSFLQPQGEEMRGMGENSNSYNIHLSVTNTLNYIKTFNKVHNLNVMLGQEAQKTILKQAYLAGSNYPVEDMPQVQLAATPGSAATQMDRLTLASFFGNVEYDYANKYYLSASLRADGSSRFASGNRWGVFASVGAKYRISSEKFMESTKNWLDNLTIRASYGSSGNSEVGNSWYASKDLYGFGWNYNSQPGMAYEQMGNDDLKWERTKKFNIGFDATLFKRFNIEFDYYVHNTTDMVFAVPASYAMGLTSFYKNIGELQNKGIEFTIGANIIKNKDWNWNVSFTGSHNKNEVKKLSTDMPIEGTYQITEVGRPIYQFKMKEYAGVDPQTGDALWYLNEEGDETTTNYNAAAKRYVGDANPSFYGAFTNNLNWKGIDFSFQLNYSFGRKIYGNNLRYDEQIGGSFGENFTEYVYENRWQKPGDITDVPRLNVGYGLGTESSLANSASSRFLMNGNYVKLRNITLGYTFPSSLTEKIYISRLRVYVQADNLYTWGASDYRGLDPASVGANGVQWWNFPQSRNVVFGLNVSF